MSIEPDTKDWTWVLHRPCDECGFDPAGVDVGRLPQLVRDNAAAWREVLAGPDPAVRPADNVWSPLEYACHVRDVHRVFADRVRLMLAEDAPQFANWDQDAAAVEQDYGSQDPAVVSTELVESAERIAEVFAGVSGGQWDRTGLRSNGSEFTVRTLGVYYLHDIEHHLHDVAR